MNLRSMNKWRFLIARKIVVLPFMVLGMLLITSESTVAQSPQVELSSTGEPTLCKGCGHWKEDLWQIRRKLKNISDQDITVYGQEGADGEFNFVSDGQLKDPYSCEWRYWNGETENRNRWQNLPDNYKIPKILKPGEEIEVKGGIGDYESRRGILTRFVSYIASGSGEKPIEVFSSPLKSSLSEDEKNLTYQIVEDKCVRDCKMDTFVPNIQGVKLGMTVKEVQALFPYAKVNYIRKEFRWGLVKVWDRKAGAWDLNISFVNDKVGEMEPSFTSLRGTGRWPDIYQRVAKVIGMKDYVDPSNGAWRCSDFAIDVVTNDDPTITISSKTYKRFQAERNEERFIKRQ